MSITSTLRLTVKKMTTNEAITYLRSLPGETISPQELAKVAGGNAYSYNLAAKEGRLDLPHLWRGRNLRIWKGPVIRLIGGSDVQAVSDDKREADEGRDFVGRFEASKDLPALLAGRWPYDCASPVGSDLVTK